MCEAEKDLKFPNYIAGDGWVHHSPVFYLLFQLLPRVGSESIFSLNYLQKFLDFLDHPALHLMAKAERELPVQLLGTRGPVCAKKDIRCKSPTADVFMIQLGSRCPFSHVWCMPLSQANHTTLIPDQNR